MKFLLFSLRIYVTFCILLTSLALPLAARSQQGGTESGSSQAVVTARKCDVRIDQFKSKCGTQVNLLDNRQISVIFVTVKSIPEVHEISFYTEHVGMLVISVDGQMIPVRGKCKNSDRSLHCSSDDKKAVLKIRW